MRRAMLRLVCGVIFVISFLSGSRAVAQAGADQTAGTQVRKFAGRTQLVLVPVVVTDEHGKHVSGLGRGAFKIEEGKKEREATIFEEVKTVAPETEARAAKVAGYSNFAVSDVHNWRVSVVVLDLLNTGYMYWPGGKEHLVDFLSKTLANVLESGEPVAMYALGTKGLKQLHPFTSDTAVLVEALRHVQARVGPEKIDEPPAAPGESAERHKEVVETAQRISDFFNDRPAVRFNGRDLARTTLEAMKQIADGYAAIPGRKTLIWASGGLPLPMDDPDRIDKLGLQTGAIYDRAWRALVASEIAAYPVDLDLVSDRSSSMFRRDSLTTLAQATGGNACIKKTEMEACMARALEDSHAYYLLGYYLPENDQKAGWRKLKVTVEATGAEVRARNGFYTPGPAVDNEEARQGDIVDALHSPVNYTGVRMNVREMPVSGGPAGGQRRQEFSVRVLGSSVTVDAQNGNAMDMTMVAVAFTESGANAGHAELHIGDKVPADKLEELGKFGVRGTPSLELGPGKYNIRIAVRENLSGRMGSVAFPLEVQ